LPIVSQPHCRSDARSGPRAFGFLIFDTVPDAWTLVGATIIIAGRSGARQSG
jgi:hypothetical protein